MSGAAMGVGPPVLLSSAGVRATAEALVVSGVARAGGGVDLLVLLGSAGVRATAEALS